MLASSYVPANVASREIRKIHHDEVQALIDDGEVTIKGNFYPNSISVALTCANDGTVKKTALSLVPAPKSLLFEKNPGNKEELGKWLRGFGKWSDETIQEELDFLFAVPV